MISILILTKNEELDIGSCIKSVSWSDDINVLDSFSSDKTINIAQSYGAKIKKRKFDNFASQRNAALKLFHFKYKWVLILDADERITEDLKNEIFDFVSNCKKAYSAVRIRRDDYLWNTWLKHAQISPFYLRLVQPEKVKYEREINEVLKVKGKIYEFKESFKHYPFSKGFTHWIEKHNQYSSMEALLISIAKHNKLSIKKAFFSSDFNERRTHQKIIFYKLPFRPLIKFLYMIFYRCSFLDGKAGIVYAFLQAIYEYMIVIKTYELNLKK